MNDQFRALCAELTERLEWFIAEDETNENDPGNQYWLTGKQAGIDSVTRARALLAQPVAEGRSSDGGYEAGSMWAGHPIRPSADERTTISNVAEGPSADEWDALVVRAWDQYETVGYQGERFMYDSDFGNALDLVRRELARFGHPTPQPVPVSERLPGPEDCDEQGRCWWFTPKEGNTEPFRCADWSFYAGWRQKYTHWIPANALPTPSNGDD